MGWEGRGTGDGIGWKGTLVVKGEMHHIPPLATKGPLASEDRKINLLTDGNGRLVEPGNWIFGTLKVLSTGKRSSFKS